LRHADGVESRHLRHQESLEAIYASGVSGLTTPAHGLRENLEAVMNCLRAGLVYPTIGALGWLERVSVKVGPNRDGTGTPCTIRNIEGRTMEMTPEPTHFTSEFRDEVKNTVGKAVVTLEELMGQLKQVLLPGNKTLGKKELNVLLEGIEHAVMQVKSNLPYVEKCFDETMENKMSEALIEFEGITSQRLRDIGINAVQASLPESTFKRGLGLPDRNDPCPGGKDVG